MKTKDIDSDVVSKVREHNEQWHDNEAEHYDYIRAELWNFLEQWRINRDISKIDDLISGRKVVDIGCGTGNLVLKFANLGYEVKAVDISENMLEVLEDKLTGELSERVETFCCEADKYLDPSVEPDVVCFSSVLHHLPDYYEVLSKAISSLKPGGVIYIVHEPLTHQRDGHPHLEFLDNLLTLKSSIQKWRSPDKTKDTVDFHIDSKEGVDYEGLIDFFETKGMEIQVKETYSTWKSGVLSTVDNFFRLTSESDFKIIAQKERA